MFPLQTATLPNPCTGATYLFSDPILLSFPSSSARNPKLQLTAEQPLTGEYWIPPKKVPHVQG